MFNFWRYLFAMCLTSIGMVTCLVLGVITGDLIFRDIGLACVIAGISILVIMVFRMRSMFKNFGQEFGGKNNKTWRSYPRDG